MYRTVLSFKILLILKNWNNKYYNIIPYHNISLSFCAYHGLVQTKKIERWMWFLGKQLPIYSIIMQSCECQIVVNEQDNDHALI